MNTPDPRTPLRKLYDAINVTAQAEYWWDDRNNIVAVAYWMLERDHGVRDFVSLIEKPWKWTAEYEQAMTDFAAEDAAAEETVPYDMNAPIPWTEEDQALYDRPDVVAKREERQRLEREFLEGFGEGRPDVSQPDTEGDE